MTLASVCVRDPVVVHVLVDLHPEELRRQELADLAVPRRARVQARIGSERAGEVLVHADRNTELVVAEPDRVGRERQRARGRRAPVVDVGERDTGQAEQRDHRVGVVDLVAAAERELDVAPLHSRVRERAPDRDRTHVDARHVREPPERVQPHPDNRDPRSCGFDLRPSIARAEPRTTSGPTDLRLARHVTSPQLTGRNANVTTSLPSSSVLNGTSTSSISMPVCSAAGSAIP